LTGCGLVKYDDTNWTVYDKSNSLIPSNEVTCITIDQSDNLWIGTTEGLAGFDDTNWTVFNVLNSGLSNNGVVCISIDDYDNKWLGTWNGLAVFNENGVVSVDENDTFIKTVPNGYALSQNFPNPFNPSTTIEFTLPKSEFVELKVYSILGKEVVNLVSAKLQQGKHTYTFDGENLASGIYYYQLTAGDYREVKKMILLR
jgi:ligand-binding sensor domain-containing protein